MFEWEVVCFATSTACCAPKSIAIIGASDSSRGGWAQEIYDNLDFCGFPPRLYLVNPKRDELWGRKVYPNFAAIPEAVDLALTIIPSAPIPDTLAEAAEHGLKCALIYAAQFGEGGDAEGKKRSQALLALSREARAAHLRAELHGLARAARKAPALSGQARALAQCRLGRRRVPVRRHFSVLAAAGVRCAGSTSPMRCRAATSSISISPTTSTSWSTTSTPGSLPAWWKACGGRRPSWPRPKRRWRRKSRSCW